MGENSQSRYSIVSDLCAKKLAIMDEKQQISGDVARKRLKIDQLKANIEKQIAEHNKQIKDITKWDNDEIEKLEQEIAADEDSEESKAKLCDQKILEIDKALKAIQDISKESAEEAKQG